MAVILILLGILCGTGALLYIHDRLTVGRDADNTVAVPSADEEPECCGMHITCQRDSLLTAVNPEIVYYDDEELDRYQGRQSDDYTDTEIEEFRDILLTLLPTDIAGWGRSLQLRQITLPTAVRDELLMIVAEQRAAKTSSK